MHLIPATNSLQSYLLDLIYLSATLQASGHPELAAPVQAKIHDLRAQRVRYERAEELEVVATATVAADNLNLGAALMQSATHVKAHHPELYAEFYEVAPSRTKEKNHTDELQAVRELCTHLETLPHDDDVRTEFAPLLRGHADTLESDIAHKNEVLQQLSVVRSAGDRARVSVNTLRTTVHAQLVIALGSQKAADGFFRPTPKPAAHAAAATPTVPAAPTAPESEPTKRG